MKTVIKFLGGIGMASLATPAFAHMLEGGSEMGMWDGYSNIAGGFTMILVWIVLLLLIGVLWKNLHH